MNRRCFSSALRLYTYIHDHHWNGSAVVGPDPGVRWDRVLFRFVKSVLSFIPWKDDRYMLQCQGYWIRDNWLLFDLTSEEQFKDTAIRATETVLSQQHPDGYWSYALPGWRRRIATVEGDYAALGLLASYPRTKDERYLAGALKWKNFLNSEIGYSDYQGSECIHYFAGGGGALVPNNATLTLELLGELYHATGDTSHLEHCQEMTGFLKQVQLESGELPYSVGVESGFGRTHFMCYQYNAFQLLDLIHYYQTTEDNGILDVMKRMAYYLSTGIHRDGHAYYACTKKTPEVIYYSAALGAALLESQRIGLGGYGALSNRAYERVMRFQKQNGGFPYSFRNYGILKDTRSYPRYLSMILFHLLLRADNRGTKVKSRL